MPSDSTQPHPVIARHALTAKVPIASPNTTVKQIESILNTEKSDQFDSINYIYVVTANQELKGVLSVKEIFRQPKNMILSEIMKTDLVTIRARSHQEKAALLAIRHNIKALPVVDKDNKFLGAITSDTILSILHSANLEDQFHSSGIGVITSSYSSFANHTVLANLKMRIPWLIVGLLGGVFAASIVTGFDHVIEELVLLAAFLPAVIYIGDAVGAQSQMILIRTLALDQKLKFGNYLARELTTSGLIGTIIGASAGIIAHLFWANFKLSLIVAVSFFFTIIVSSMVAVLLPLGFNKLKIDPAIGSGPLATVIRDILSIIVYFLVASLILL